MTTTWIPLLVPDQDYQELADLVARRTIERGDGVSPAALLASADESRLSIESPVETDAGTTALQALRPWEMSDLRRLSESSVLTAQRWARALDVCARHVNAYLSTQQIAAEAGMSVNEWRDAARKISRHLKHHYPNVPAWPLAVKSARRLGINEDQVYWAINDEQADRWTQARRDQA